jgi:hypothetical protein
VQALLSLQLEPSARFGFVQVPVAGWQTPATWHWSSGWQTTGLEPTHAPA